MVNESTQCRPIKIWPTKDPHTTSSIQTPSTNPNPQFLILIFLPVSCRPPQPSLYPSRPYLPRVVGGDVVAWLGALPLPQPSLPCVVSLPWDRPSPTALGCVWFSSLFSWPASLLSGSLRPGSEHAESRCLVAWTSRARLERASVWLLVRDKLYEIKILKKL
jgi:hypothetical protein